MNEDDAIDIGVSVSMKKRFLICNSLIGYEALKHSFII